MCASTTQPAQNIDDRAWESIRLFWQPVASSIHNGCIAYSFARFHQHCSRLAYFVAQIASHPHYARTLKFWHLVSQNWLNVLEQDSKLLLIHGTLGNSAAYLPQTRQQRMTRDHMYHTAFCRVVPLSFVFSCAVTWSRMFNQLGRTIRQKHSGREWACRTQSSPRKCPIAEHRIAWKKYDLQVTFLESMS